MKNVQIIDGAENCVYDIFSVSDEAFAQVFPEDGQNIAFIEEVLERLGEKELRCVMQGFWQRPCPKPEVQGIHGTLFYQLEEKKAYYPTRRESDLNFAGRGWDHP